MGLSRNNGGVRLVAYDGRQVINLPVPFHGHPLFSGCTFVYSDAIQSPPVTALGRFDREGYTGLLVYTAFVNV